MTRDDIEAELEILINLSASTRNLGGRIADLRAMRDEADAKKYEGAALAWLASAAPLEYFCALNRLIERGKDD